ncbi:MAG: serine/threonine-protein kinase [Labilithrix sp.]
MSGHLRDVSHDSRATVLAERYVLRGELGRGGCAVVYEAHDTRLGRLVALKMVKSSARDAQANARLAREARAGAAIHHPNVCGLSDAGYLPDGRPYLVMERLHGETLTSCLRRVGNLSAEHAVDLALQLRSGLEAAHAIGSVHRDVKPDNVFLVPRNGATPLVKLLDFGMCRRAATPSGDDRTLTRAGQVVGTPEYMSPEQVSGKRSFDGRIDLYAVGVILYEVLSGQRAFPGKDAREVVVSVLVKSLPPLRHFRPDIPSVLDRVVSRAMERDANARYSTAQEFMADLVECKRQMQEKRRAMMQTGPRRIDPRLDERQRHARHESLPPPAPPRSVESDEWDNQPTIPVRAMSRPARIA